MLHYTCLGLIGVTNFVAKYYIAAVLKIPDLGEEHKFSTKAYCADFKFYSLCPRSQRAELHLRNKAEGPKWLLLLALFDT